MSRIACSLVTFVDDANVKGPGSTNTRESKNSFTTHKTAPSDPNVQPGQLKATGLSITWDQENQCIILYKEGDNPMVVVPWSLVERIEPVEPADLQLGKPTVHVQQKKAV